MPAAKAVGETDRPSDREPVTSDPEPAAWGETPERGREGVRRPRESGDPGDRPSPRSRARSDADGVRQNRERIANPSQGGFALAQHSGPGSKPQELVGHKIPNTKYSVPSTSTGIRIPSAPSRGRGADQDPVPVPSTQYPVLVPDPRIRLGPKEGAEPRGGGSGTWSREGQVACGKTGSPRPHEGPGADQRTG
jgi:hypothetical protein